MCPDRQPTTWSLFLTRMVRRETPLPRAAHEQLAKTSDLDLRQRWLARKDCPPDLLLRSLATCTDKATFNAHFDLLARTPEQLEVLLDHEGMVVVVAAALHPDCPDGPAAAALYRASREHHAALKAAFLAAPAPMVPLTGREATAAAFVELAPLCPKCAPSIVVAADAAEETLLLARRIRSLHPTSPATCKVLGSLVDAFPLACTDHVAPVAEAASFVAARAQTPSIALAVEYWASPGTAIEHMAPADATVLHPRLRTAVLLAAARHPDPAIVADAIARSQGVITANDLPTGPGRRAMPPKNAKYVVLAALTNPATPEEFIDYLLDHADPEALVHYVRSPRFDPQKAPELLARLDTGDDEFFGLAAAILSRVGSEESAVLATQIPTSALELLLHYQLLPPDTFSQTIPVATLLNAHHDPGAVFSYLHDRLGPQAFEAAVLLLENFSGSLGDLVATASAVVAPANTTRPAGSPTH